MNKIRIWDAMALAVCVPFVAVTIPPTLQHSRERVHRTRCISNMKKLWSAFLAFAEDHDGHLPATGWCQRNSEHDWTWGGNIISVPQTNPAACMRIRIEEGALWSYVTGCARVGPYGEWGRGMTDEWYADPRTNIYVCPGVGPVGKKRGLSYSMNYGMDQDGSGMIGIKLSQIKNAAKKVLLVDESDETVNDGMFIPTGHEGGFRIPSLRHARGTHLLFCDGHVAWIDGEQLLQIMNRNDPESFDPLWTGK